MNEEMGGGRRIYLKVSPLFFELPCSSCWRALSTSVWSEFLIRAHLIRVHLAHAQKINKFFALGQKLERDGGDDKQVINLIRP